MNPSSDYMLGLLNKVWSSLMDEELRSHIPAEDMFDNHTFRTAGVTILGPEQYAVFIDCSEQLVVRITASMFDTSIDGLSNEEIVDALGEFVNMVAGEIEGTLIGNFQIGIPVVSKSRKHKLNIPSSHILMDCWAIDDSAPIRALFLLTEAR